MCIQLFFDSLQTFHLEVSPSLLQVEHVQCLGVFCGIRPRCPAGAGGWHRGVWVEKRVMLSWLAASWLAASFMAWGYWFSDYATSAFSVLLWSFRCSVAFFFCPDLTKLKVFKWSMSFKWRQAPQFWGHCKETTNKCTEGPFHCRPFNQGNLKVKGFPGTTFVWWWFLLYNELGWKTSAIWQDIIMSCGGNLGKNWRIRRGSGKVSACFR